MRIKEKNKVREIEKKVFNIFNDMNKEKIEFRKIIK